MRLSLQHCVPEDVDQVVHLIFHTLATTQTDRMINLFFGHPTPQGYLGSKRVLSGRFKDTIDWLIKVVDLDAPRIEVRGIDPETGDFSGEITKQARVLGFANWRVFSRYAPENPSYGKSINEGGTLLKGEHMAHLPTEEERNECAAVLNVWQERKRREQKEAHVHLVLMMVDEEFRGKGLGGMMMDWGDRVADSLGVSCWVEGSEMGKGLYARHGYVVLHGGKKWKLEGDGIGDGCETWVMRRPEKALMVESREEDNPISAKATSKVEVSEVVSSEV